MYMKKRKKSEDGVESEKKRSKGLEGQTAINVFNDWNTEISKITEEHHEELATKVEHLFQGVGKELESGAFGLFQNQEEFLFGFLRSPDIENNISQILEYLEKYKNSLNTSGENSSGDHIFGKFKKALSKIHSKLLSQNIVKENKFIIKNWTYLLPILLSSSIPDIEVFVILDCLPEVVRFLIKSIRRFQLSSGKFGSESTETINMYKSILERYKFLNETYNSINNITLDRITMEVQDPLSIYIKNSMAFIEKTKTSRAFIPFEFGHDNLSSKSKKKFSLESSQNSSQVLYMLHGNNICSLGVFGKNFLERKMNLDNMWQLNTFTNKFKTLVLGKRMSNPIQEGEFNIEKIDAFIGTLGYGISSFDSLNSMNPRPELNNRENSNRLRYELSKKVFKRYLKEMGSKTKVKTDFSQIPLIRRPLITKGMEEDERVGTKDFSRFPSLPNTEPGREKLKFNETSLYIKDLPLGFVSKIRQELKSKRELELVVMDIKECSNYFPGQRKASSLRNLRFNEYGLFWKTSTDDNGNIPFKMVPLRTCTASIHHSVRFKSHIYYTRFLLEQLINSNWKKRIITKNKKYYKLSSLVNGGFLTKSQKESVNKISRIIINNGLWEDFSDIFPKLLTRTDKSISDLDLQDWEDFDKDDEFDKEMSRLASENKTSSGSKSSEFYGKYLKLSSKNYKLVSKRCQKMLAKYIFKEYPRFLTQYFKIRKEWHEFNKDETQKRNKQNINNSSRLQLDIIGYSGDKNVKAQFSNFKNLDIKHEIPAPNTVKMDDPQTMHIIKMEKKIEEQNTFSLLPKFDSSLPLNQIYRLNDFVPSSLIVKNINVEWNKDSRAENTLFNFTGMLFSQLKVSSVLSITNKEFFLKLIFLVDWVIHILNHSRKSFGGARAIQKCIKDSIESRKRDDPKLTNYSKIPTEFSNWIIDSFLSKYQTETFQTRFSFSNSGENKLFVLLLWVSNFIYSHSNNINYKDYADKNEMGVPEFLPSSSPSPIDFADLLLEDLRDKYTRKFRNIAHSIGFRSANQTSRNFKSNNYLLPQGVTKVILNSYPRL
ncbi:hypothetical protein HWI79_553 [Cryptosporidium felis]|nr:hypothetical protein HWI79_553 [Cryptosporidium felis]